MRNDTLRVWDATQGQIPCDLGDWSISGPVRWKGTQAYSTGIWREGVMEQDDIVGSGHGEESTADSKTATLIAMIWGILVVKVGTTWDFSAT